MKIQFDDGTDLDSWIHRWDARFKVIGLVGLMMAFASVRSVLLLPGMILIVTFLYCLARLPLSFLMARLRYPGLFLVGIVVFLPWLSGHTPLWQWGPFTLWQEGCLSALLISVRFLCSVTLGFIVLGTTPFLTLVRALGSLGVPPILTDMMLLSYRYLFEILASLDRMRRAMTLRGFQPLSSHRRSGTVTYSRSFFNQVTVVATLAGTLFIRSYEQAERVYQAMRLRGYGYRLNPLTTARFGGQNRLPTLLNSSSMESPIMPRLVTPYFWDAIALLVSLLVSAILLGANYWLPRVATLVS